LSRPEAEEARTVLVELGLVEQRHKAVLEVLEGGLSIVEVARRYGVVRQTVHDWLRRYGRSGIVGLADRSSKPAACPHQMAPEIEARVLELRRDHPAWGPRTIRYELAAEGVDPVPGPVVGVSGVGPPWLGRSAAPPPAPVGDVVEPRLDRADAYRAARDRHRRLYEAAIGSRTS
jgi:hypothetical protein